MAYHDFGIMEDDPKKNQRFDESEPEKFDCIKINDDFIEPLLNEFQNILCYYHTLECPGMNIAYSGITIIPPESIDDFISVFNNHHGGKYEKIIELFEKAKMKNKYIIHFGI